MNEPSPMPLIARIPAGRSRRTLIQGVGGIIGALGLTRASSTAAQDTPPAEIAIKREVAIAGPWTLAFLERELGRVP